LVQPLATADGAYPQETGRKSPEFATCAGYDRFLAVPRQLKLFMLSRIMSSAQGRRNNSAWEETIFRFSRRTEETGDGYQGGNKTADSAET
jgi:hypothetical protein